MSYLFDYNDNICVKCRNQAKIFKKLLFSWFKFYKIDSKTISNVCNDIQIRKVLKNFFKGLAIFGLRTPFVMGAPLSIVWNYTKKCNLKCFHCFVDATNKKSENELTTEQVKKVIDILSANDVVTINFCGGEPLTKKDIFEVIKYTQEHDIYPSISTNATLLSKNMCKKLYDSGIRSVTISLDSYSPENHDRLRQVPGSFEMTINGISNAVEFGKFEEIIINTTLTDYNYQEIPQIYELVKELGATKYYISRILPTGRGKNYMEHDVSNEIKRSVMKFMANKLIEFSQGKDKLMVLGRGMSYYSRTCHGLSKGKIYPLCEILTGYEPKYKKIFNNQASNLIYRLAPFFSGCATGLFYCGLDCEGNVIPCAPANSIKLGNILEKGLHEIWVKNPILNQIRERSKITGKCSKCESKAYCGGCRLTAYGLTGSWLGADLSCPY
ncbi:MAG: radical SAM protein [Promethearchaeota archaeon]